MLKVTKKFAVLILFLLVDFMIIGFSGEYQPFYAMEKILIPYNFENNRLIISYFVINFLVYIIFVSTAVKSTEEQFLIIDYVLTRTDKTHAIILHIIKTYKELLFIVLIKMIADVMMGQMNGIINLDKLILLALSEIITAFIWTLVIIIMKLKNIKTKFIYFTTLLLILILQFSAFYFKRLTVFVIASQYFLSLPVLFISLKIIILFTLGAYVLSLVKNYESLGAEKI